MPETGEPQLSLSAWLVLCLICEEPSHGFPIAAALAPEGTVGRVWHVPKAMVYRAMQQLEEAGLIRGTGPERSRQGPVRTRYSATAAGRHAARAWLSRPAVHPRDIRTELLAKLALLDRAGADPQELLRAQRAELEPIAAALDDRLRTTGGFDRILILWRNETLSATMRFLETAGAASAERTAGT